MPKGRPTTLTVSLTPTERQILQAWQRAQNVPLGRARRGRMLLLLEEGRTITQIAATVGMSRRFLYTWVQRFLAQGLPGLVDLPRHVPAHRRRRAPTREAPP